MNPIWTLLPPLAAIPFILYFGERRRNLREGSIVVAGVALLIVNVLVYRALLAGEPVESGAFALLGGFGSAGGDEVVYSLRLAAEPMGVMFGLLASFLWIVTTFYSVGYMRGHGEEHQTRFYTCFAIALAAVMAAAYAANLLTLFVAYEALTLSTFPLVTHAGNDASRRAGRVYLGILLATSIGLLLPAIIWTSVAAGSQRCSGMTAALPMPNVNIASSSASEPAPRAVPPSTPPGTNASEPAATEVQMIAGSSSPMEVASRMPR